MVQRKTRRKRRTRRTRHTRKTRHRRHTRHTIHMRGGNYTTATVRELDGVPIISPNKMTVIVPGLGVLSGEDYIKHMNK